MADKFERIIEAIQNEKPTITIATTTILDLSLYINAGYEVYKNLKIFNKDARSEVMSGITTILADQKLDDDGKIKEIQRLIYHPDKKYHRGLLGNSKFADCISAAIYLFQCDLARQKLLNTYSKDEIIQAYHALKSMRKEQKADTDFYNSVVEGAQIDSPPANISIEFTKLIEKAHKNLPSTGIETEQKSKLTLADYYLYGIQRYLDKVVEPSDKRKKNIEELRAIILLNQEKKESEDALANKINEYLNTPEFKKTARFGSILKKYCQDAKDDFIQAKHKLDPKNEGTGLTRTRMVRKWLPKEGLKNKSKSEPPGSEQTQKSGRKVILAIHGFQDSVATWEGVAPQWAKANYEVIAYDQAGHGFDELRTRERKLNLRQMQYDLYDQLQQLQADSGVDEIHIVGHSLGGALLANSLATINGQLPKKPRENEPALPNKIKSVSLISPAVMASAFLETVSNAWTNITRPGDMGPGVEKLRRNKESLSRIGGPSLVGKLMGFINFVSTGFTHLRKLARGLYDTALEDPVPVYIMHGSNDKLVNKESFSILKEWSRWTKTPGASPKTSPVTIQEIVGINHHPHALGSATDKLVGNEILDKIENASKASPSPSSQPSKTPSPDGSGGN